jgi:hypothetical protein
MPLTNDAADGTNPSPLVIKLESKFNPVKTGFEPRSKSTLNDKLFCIWIGIEKANYSYAD